MLVTNQTVQDYFFGPLHLAGGIGQTLTVDDTSDTSLYLTEDAVADAIDSLYLSGKITVSSAASPFPRPTGIPQLLHGDGSPEGLVYAPQGSIYMRRDGIGPNSVYTKTTGVTINTGWTIITVGGLGTTYRKTTAKAVNNSTAETDLLNGEISLDANVLGTTGVARIYAAGDWLQNTTTLSLPQFKLKLGATTLIDTGAPGGNSAGQSATRGSWRLEAAIANLGAANSQWVSLLLHIFPGSVSNQTDNQAFATGQGAYTHPVAGVAFVCAEGVNSGAVDTTATQALAFTVINRVANASYDVKLYNALVTIV
jgi:hypothetical protein